LKKKQKMKKDIEFPKVKDVGMAIVLEGGEGGEQEWYVYLVNRSDEDLEMVIINSRGYGEIDGAGVKTATLRKLIERVPAASAVRVEPIMDELFDIANEFWLSFWKSGKMYDRRYVFVEGSVRDRNMTPIPYTGKMGVLII
jgi:hypothetical protein